MSAAVKVLRHALLDAMLRHGMDEPHPRIESVAMTTGLLLSQQMPTQKRGRADLIDRRFRQNLETLELSPKPCIGPHPLRSEGSVTGPVAMTLDCQDSTVLACLGTTSEKPAGVPFPAGASERFQNLIRVGDRVPNKERRRR